MNRVPQLSPDLATRRTFSTGLLGVIVGGVCGILTAAPKPEIYALVAGTVFRDDGFALPGAKVSLTRKSGQGKFKKLDLIANFRGEFTFRVPPGEATYVVHATAAHFQPTEKEVTLTADDHVEVTLSLSPESK